MKPVYARMAAMAKARPPKGTMLATAPAVASAGTDAAGDEASPAGVEAAGLEGVPLAAPEGVPLAEAEGEAAGTLGL
jgi:hypothetical protein